MLFILIILLGYLIGNISFGMTAANLFKVDLRSIGSGNIGATNVYRALGIKVAIAVFILDLLKGTAAVVLAQLFVPANPPFLTKETFVILTGIASVIGHMYPVFLGFKGGKGAATSLGVLLGIAPDLFALALIYVIVCIAITRYVSLTTVTGVILFSILMITFHKPVEYQVASIIIALLVLIKHIPNIVRLINGTEPKIWGNPHPVPINREKEVRK
jgi:glycerol-3-phosphate acyltransferase PlsY